MKIAINKQHGGFGLSDKAFEKLLQLRGIEFESVESKYGGIDYYVKGYVGDDDYFISQYEHYSPRNDENLISVIEEFGEEANGFAAFLKIVEIPDDVEWQLEEYDGWEWIAEKHRIWE
jgi:hypothetical protein